MLYRMGILIALLAGPAFAQFGSGDYHGARWDPILRCWVFPDGKNTAGVPWNQRLLRGDATGDGVTDGATGSASGKGPAVDPFASDGPPFGELFKPASNITLEARNEVTVNEIIRQATADAAVTRAAIRLPDGTPNLIVTTEVGGEILGQFRMPDSAVFSVDVATAKAGNTGHYINTAVLHPLDQVPGTPPGQTFSNRTFRYLAMPRFPEGMEGGSLGPLGGLTPPTGGGPPLPLPPKPEQPKFVNPFPPLPPDVLRRLEEARKKLAAKQLEEALANLPQVVVAQEELLDALREVGDVMDRKDPRRRVVGAEMIVVGDSIVLQTVGGQIIAPYDPPVTGGTAGFSTGPRKLSDGTLHYPYVPGLPVTDNYLRPDGGLVSAYGDGSKEYTGPDGTRVLRTRDGYKRVISADGTVTWFDPQGRLVQMEDRISATQHVLWAVVAQSYIKEINAQYDTEIPLTGITQLYSNNGAFFPEEE